MLQYIQEADSILKGEDIHNERALHLYRMAFDISQKSSFINGHTQSIMGLSHYYYLHGQYDQAEPLLQHALKTSNLKDRVGIEINMGTVLKAKGNYHKAMLHYFNALKQLRQENNTMHAKGAIYQNIGTVLIKLQRYSEALSYFNKAEQEAIRIKDDYLLATVLLNKGEAYYNQNLIKDTAEQYFFDALLIAEKRNWNILQEHALNQLARNARDKGQYEKALQFVLKAEQLSSISNSGKIIISLNKGWIYLGLNQYTKATFFFNKAYNSAISTTPELLSEIYNGLGKTAKAMSQYKEALAYFELAVKMEDSLYGKTIANRVSQLEQDYLTMQQQHELTKRELKISLQSNIIKRKNVQTYIILSSVLILSILVITFFKYHQRIQKQKSEITAWQATLKGEENERSRLAHELHDNIGGSLSTVKMWLGTIQKQDAHEKREKDFEDAMQLLDQTLCDLRDTAHHLMPEFLLRHGLAKAVRIYCENIQKAGKMVVEYHYFGFIGTLEKKLDLLLYRIIQELLQNVIKHANASFVLVQLSQHDDILSVTIEDNGMGMTKMDETKGMGIQNIKNNINNLNGQFNLKSEKGHGTTVYFEINVTKSILR